MAKKNVLDAKNLNSTPTTSTQVNAVLKAIGVEERLVRGNGYWYFAEGRASAWNSSSVSVFRITSYTIQGWLEQYILLAYEDASYATKVEFRADGKGLVVVNRDRLDRKKFGTVAFTSEDAVAVLNWLRTNAVHV
jgi:hypothetical protein